MATICKSGKGKNGWVAAATFEGRRRYFYGQSKGIVKARLHSAIADSVEGRPVAPREQKVGAFLTQWLEQVAGTVQPGTHEFYTWAIVGHIIPELGGLTLTQLSTGQVTRFLKDKGNTLSPRSVCHLKSALRAALAVAEDSEEVTRNVARRAKAPKIAKTRIEPMSSDQYKTFRDKIRGHRLESLFVTATATGFRQSELLGLTWNDVDFANSAISVRKQLEFRQGRFDRVKPKTEMAIRTVGLPGIASDLLSRRRQAQLEERMAAGNPSDWNRFNLVFTSAAGNPLFAKNVRSSMYSILKVAGLSPFTFHSLRHLHATTELSNGVPVQQVSLNLGHASPRVTLDVYSHDRIEDRQRSADVMQQFLSAAG